jgi:dipeptidyl aminopeptidase/acylaminoacyl peptidase
VTEILSGPHAISSFCAAGSLLAAVVEDPTMPPSIVEMHHEAGSHMQSLETLMSDKVTAADMDSGLLLRPKTGGSLCVPVVMLQEGPSRRWGQAYNHEANCLARAGHTVVGLNLDWPSNPLDLRSMATTWPGALKSALKTAGTNPEQVAIIGPGLGGFVACWIGIEGGCATIIFRGGATNLLSLSLTSEAGWDLAALPNSPDPVENARAFIDASPLLRMADLKVPTLIQHAEYDSVVSLDQAEQLFTGLLGAGTKARLVVYRKETSHLIQASRPTFRVHQIESTIAWLSENDGSGNGRSNP